MRCKHLSDAVRLAALNAAVNHPAGMCSGLPPTISYTNAARSMTLDAEGPSTG
jgi:hypothetical protein